MFLFNFVKFFQQFYKHTIVSGKKVQTVMHIYTWLLQNITVYFLQKTNSSFNFRNKLVYAESDPKFPFIIRRHVWDLTVECDVPRETVVHTHVHHNVLHLPDTIMTPSPEHSAVSLAFYRDQEFLHSISGPPLHIKVGDTVYVKAFMPLKETDVKLVLRSCYMAPQVNATDTLKYFIINNG